MHDSSPEGREPAAGAAGRALLELLLGLFALGIVIGYPLLFPEIDRTTILFLATGAPAITLITVGLVMARSVRSGADSSGSNAVA